MLVKVNTSLAGANFAFRFGEEVEQDVFAALVGNGWESLCDPVEADGNDAIVENAVEAHADETAVAEPVVETADAPPTGETTSKRGRRK
ncbi:hypothetical protein [Rhizobium sp. 768_B6_N1_8]|uniref:hypothetical protein n=1 Tax=unclassified Rhizobium TaxID=2613769 RepID=UPI003F22873C